MTSLLKQYRKVDQRRRQQGLGVGVKGKMKMLTEHRRAGGLDTGLRQLGFRSCANHLCDLGCDDNTLYLRFLLWGQHYLPHRTVRKIK